jgi:hypothetical protein
VTSIKFVALAAGVGALVTAGSLVNPPVARADCNPFEGCYGAAAASPSAGEAEVVTNYGEQSHAEDNALLECNVQGKTNDCQLLVSGLGCLSVADLNGTYAGGIAGTQDAADADALSKLPPGATIDLRQCNLWG